MNSTKQLDGSNELAANKERIHQDIDSNKQTQIEQTAESNTFMNIIKKQVSTQTNFNEFTKNPIKTSSHKDSIKDMIKHLRNEAIKLVIKVHQVEHKWLKFYLCLLLLFVLAISGYMLANLIISYLAYEVLTTTRSILETESLFPKITICNNNMFQTEFALEFLKKVHKEVCDHQGPDKVICSQNYFFNTDMKSFFDEYSSNNAFYTNVSKTEFLKSVPSNLNPKPRPNCNSSSAEDSSFIHPFDPPQLWFFAKAIYQRALDTINLNFTDDQKKQLSHDPSDLLQNCQFGGSPCSFDEDFIWHFDKTYGNCYVFNSGFKSREERVKLKSTIIPGSNAGFSLDFYVGSHRNLSIFNSLNSQSKGAVIRIANSSYLIDNTYNIEDMQISAGFKTLINLKRKYEFFYPEPYSNCDVSNEQDSQEKFVQSNFFYKLFAHSPYQYTREACFGQCYQQSLFVNCSCLDSRLLSLFTSEKMCSSCTQLNCHQTFINAWTWDSCVDECPLECNKTRYLTDKEFKGKQPYSVYWSI
jgi:hypothetical protein